MQDLSTYSQIKPQFPEQEHLKCPRCDSSNTKFCYYNNYNLSQPRHFCKNCKRYWTKGGTLRNIPVGGGSRKNTKRSGNPKDNKLVPGRNKLVSEDNKLGLALEDNKGRNSNSNSFSSVSTSTNTEAHQTKPDPDPAGYGLSGFDQDHRMLDVGGSFSSLLVNGQFGSMLEGLNSNGLNLDMNEFGENPNSSSGSTMIQNAGGSEFEMSNNNNNERERERERFLGGVQSGGGGGGGDSSCWNNSANGWPDLAIFTPGSSFP